MISRDQKWKILIADDDEIVREVLETALEEAGFEVVLAEDGDRAIKLMVPDIAVALLDLRMPGKTGLECLQSIRDNYPDTEVIIVTASGDIRDAIAAMKTGAFDYLTKPVESDEVVELVNRVLEVVRLRSENRELRGAMAVPRFSTSFVGNTPVVELLRQRLEKIAGLDATVLITGESGVGKSLVARMIHDMGPRSEKPMVTVSCTALPRELVEAELFGHEKGAFTGAHQRRPGRLEVADGGTVFLDEIGDMPIETQPKLLQFLQERTFNRIGGSQPVTVDVRVIAATHQELRSKCKDRTFREDLYFRLDVLPIRVPSLREREKDIPLLASFFLEKIANRCGKAAKRLSSEALNLLMSHDWPGNVRELENVLERASAFSEGLEIGIEDLSADSLHPGGVRTGVGPGSVGGLALVEVERMAIQQTLELFNGNKARAARSLGISEKSIYNKMKRLGLK